MERINLMKEYGMADEAAYNDLVAIITLMDSQFHIPLTEENAGVMITHLAAAFKRNATGEEIGPVAQAALEGLRDEPDYPQSREIMEAICETIQNSLSTCERDYLLLHLCTLLYGHNKALRKEEKKS